MVVGGHGGRLTQSQAVQLLGVCERTFRRYIYHGKLQFEKDPNDQFDVK
jgi:predicted site-specific integrase-resolvase